MIKPYLFFEGRAEEAIAFYKEALGAEVAALMRFSESPDPVPEGMIPPDWGNKVMHALIRIGEAEVMISDGSGASNGGFSGFSLALAARDEADADRLFGALSDGGEVRMPLGKTFFSPRFGMVADRFGVGWMVVVEAPTPA